MRGAAGFFEFGDKTLQPLILGKAALFDGEIDLPQIHRHHPARADIGVTNLGIAHLPARQANVGAMGDQLRLRPCLHDPVEIRRLGQQGGVALGHLAEAPTVKDAQYDRFGGAHQTVAPAWWLFSAFYPLWAGT